MATSSGSHLPSIEAKSKQNHGLLWCDEILPWYENNDCIRSGYRPIVNDTKACARSWAYLYEKTVEIYSHLLRADLALVSLAMLNRFFSWY